MRWLVLRESRWAMSIDLGKSIPILDCGNGWDMK